MQVMVNLHSAHMDPDDWQQPQQFRPERFLDESGNIINRDRVIAFSLGTLASRLALHMLILVTDRALGPELISVYKQSARR